MKVTKQEQRALEPSKDKGRPKRAGSPERCGHEFDALLKCGGARKPGDMSRGDGAVAREQRAQKGAGTMEDDAERLVSPTLSPGERGVQDESFGADLRAARRLEEHDSYAACWGPELQQEPAAAPPELLTPSLSGASDGPRADVSHSRHEAIETLIAAMVTDGQITNDLKGRKVILMDVAVPGRGMVHVRIWKKEAGIEVRLRAEDSALSRELRQERSALIASARARDVHFARVEVIG